MFCKYPGENSISLQGFLKSFSICEESSDDNIVDLDPYNRVFNEEEVPIVLDISLIQSLTFIAGYCVIQSSKVLSILSEGITHSSGVRDTEEVSSICSQCLSSLVEEETFELDMTDPVYGLICSIDRGGLKWPSAPVLEAVVILWKVYSRIEMDYSLFNLFKTSPSREILVSLTLNVIERTETEFWRNKCPTCDTIGWNILKKIIFSATNYILANKVGNPLSAPGAEHPPFPLGTPLVEISMSSKRLYVGKISLHAISDFAAASREFGPQFPLTPLIPGVEYF
ncbi:hypothetical protein LOD99_1459 [Oopsacas minuta]|uniref:Uncharacterized protein n=1 Tax=Oopsacas minuta TaxID=111878 RepID=A0AAV7K6T7_9METZ|nr:hypothetical protein LOD99_1459 [Oopsacas minuta]